MVGPVLTDTKDRKGRLLGFLVSDRGAFDRHSTLLPVRGLTVLYGLNGAGKTRAIEAIRGFWSGEWSGQVAGLIQLPPPGGIYGEHVPWTGEKVSNWASDWSRAFFDGRRDFSRLATKDDLEGILEDYVASLTYSEDYESDSVVGEQDPQREEQLLDDWRRQRLMLVVPYGTPDKPRWASAPAAMTGPDTPYFNEAADLDERLHHAEETDSWNARSYSGVGWTVAGQRILIASQSEDLLDWADATGSARHDELLPLDTVLADTQIEVHSQTRDFLIRSIRASEAEELTVSEQGVSPSAELSKLVEDVELLANRYYRSVLLDAPTLVLNLRIAGLHAGVQWIVMDNTPDRRGNRHPRALEGLSTAQSRWAVWAIGQALADKAPPTIAPQTSLLGDLDPFAPHPSSVTRLSLVDEPEAALHRSAESHMAKHIAEASSADDRSFFVATHSPELMNARDAEVIQVRRAEGRMELTPLSDVDRDTMHQLGLSPSDLLRRQRGLLLVEGLHEELILAAILGEELRRLRVDLLALRGVTALTPAVSRFIFKYTPAHMFVMLDNLSTQQIADTWTEARELAASGGIERAKALVVEQISGKKVEGRALREILTAALEDGEADRLTPYGMSLPDILDYLPVRKLVPGKKTWAELRAQHDAEKGSTPEFRDFKNWLRKARGADLSDDGIREAVSSMDVLPPDFTRLLKTIEAVTSQ
jgi:hypothetical protein